MGILVHVIRLATWWLLIQATVIISLAGVIYQDPDVLRGWIEASDALGERLAEPFTGHTGLVMSIIFDGWLIMMFGLSMVVGGMMAALSQQWAI